MSFPERLAPVLVLISLVSLSALCLSCHSAGLEPAARSSTQEWSGPGSTTVFEGPDGFNEGTVSGVRLNGDGQLELDVVSRSVIDDFMDDSMIAYMESARVDEELGFLEQEPIRTFGSLWDDNTNCGIRTSDGGFILAGYMAWSNPAVGYDIDIHIVRLDDRGAPMWNRTFFCHGRQYPRGLAETGDGDLLVVGRNESYDNMIRDTLVMKLTGDGQHLWNRSIDLSPDDQGVHVMEMQDSEIQIIGSWADAARGGYYVMRTDRHGSHIWNNSVEMARQVTINDVAEVTGGDLVLVGEIYDLHSYYPLPFAAKIRPNGGEIWNTTFGQPVAEDYLRSVEETPEGDLLICGRTYKYGAYYYDGWLIRLDDRGVEMWNRTYDFDGFEQLFDLVPVDEGAVLVGDHLGISSDLNVLTMKVNSTGDPVWVRSFGGQDYDTGSCVMNLDDGFLVGGSTSSYGNGGYDMFSMVTNSTGNYRRALIVSKDLMDGRSCSFLEQFEVISDANAEKNVKVCFSEDGSGWFDSSGAEGSWDVISVSPGRIDLGGLNLSGSHFFYKMRLESDGSSSALVGSVRLKYLTFSATGAFYSPILDQGTPSNWSSLLWEASIPEGAGVSFQIRTSNSRGGIVSDPYLGPDGTEQTFYTAPGAMSRIHYGQRFLQFKAFLETTNTSCTPTLERITIEHNRIPVILGSYVEPLTGDVTDDFSFKLSYQDLDDDPPDNISVVIDGVPHPLEGDPDDTNHTDGRTFTLTIKLEHGNHTYSFVVSDGLDGSTSVEETIFVSRGPLHSIGITADRYNMTTDEVLQFSATGYDIRGNTIKVYPTWSVSGGGTIDANGLFEAGIPGEYTVYANFSGVLGSRDIGIVAGMLHTMTIEPGNASMTTDDTLQFTAIGRDHDGNVVEISPSWSVSGGGTIDNTGLFEADEAGTFKVTAGAEDVWASIDVVIMPGRPASIFLEADRTEVYTGEKVSLSITCLDGDGNAVQQNVPLTASGGKIEGGNTFSALVPGTYNITAELDGVSDSLTINVLERPGGEDDDDDETPITADEVFPWVAVPIVTVLLLIIVLGIVILVRMRKKTFEDLQGEEPGIEEEEPGNGPKITEADHYEMEVSSGGIDVPPRDLMFGIEGSESPISWDEDLDE
ncbi:MAG: hypothetical protein ACMUHY_09725 [Thermoplasmatota archaeon]